MPAPECVLNLHKVSLSSIKLSSSSISTETGDRSGIHASTRVPTEAGFQYIPDGPHITVSFKTEQMVKDRTHITLHGYTTSLTSSGLVEVVPGGGAKPDVNEKNEPVWPKSYHKYGLETIDRPTTMFQQVPPPNQNQSLLTYPTSALVHEHPGAKGKNIKQQGPN